MPIEHTVSQGECLSSIAKQYGFADWQTIYNDPLNADFRQKRPDPNLIYPGDIIYIPDKKPKDEPCATTQTHVFQLQRKDTRLRILIQDIDGQVITGKKFHLTVEGAVYEGQIPDDGLIDKPIRPDDQNGELLVWLDETAQTPDTWQLKLGHLDPIETLSGIQARLNNLGYAAGPVDGIDGPLTQAAVQAFQADQNLTVDGIAGPQTQGALKQVYGC